MNELHPIIPARGEPEGSLFASSSLPVTAADLERYYQREAEQRPRYLGQLAPGFQAGLADLHRGVGLQDCDIYHTLDLPSGETIPGEWDLRGHESAYLGGFPLAGRRVIEYGPATGWLTNHMTRAGAEVVAFDLPFRGGPDIVPFPSIDPESARASGIVSARRLHCSWWFARKQLGFDAEIIYGDIYNPPDDLGRFDVATFGALLLHLSNPFRALQRAAAMVDDAIVVTDVYSAPDGSVLDAIMGNAPSVLLFNPSRPPNGSVHWWGLSPGVVQHMLGLLGFSDTTVTTHSPVRMTSRPPMFTVVGRRPKRGARAKPSEPMSDGHTSLPLPPASLRWNVAGTEDARTFIELGRLAYDALTYSLRDSGIEPGRLRSVLDFGCGVGRVLRYWSAHSSVSVYGTDISTEAIAWARDNLPFGRFRVNGLGPSLDDQDGSFDLIYALSVFTHLPIDIQVPWLRELVRVLRPGGFLYFTTHGSRYADMLDTQQRAAFLNGELVVTGEDQPGSNVCAAFHPESWVRQKVIEAEGLEELQFMPCGAKGNPEQDSWLLRKPA